mmetsp:Transcript_29785/g.94951  ORF Transcript_29785/g.94951 Transcript_29785/m.94951 type:complete len:209 (+) Transcript_29785:1039-1665(+)
MAERGARCSVATAGSGSLPLQLATVGPGSRTAAALQRGTGRRWFGGRAGPLIGGPRPQARGPLRRVPREVSLGEGFLVVLRFLLTLVLLQPLVGLGDRAGHARAGWQLLLGARVGECQGAKQRGQRVKHEDARVLALRGGDGDERLVNVLVDERHCLGFGVHAQVARVDGAVVAVANLTGAEDGGAVGEEVLQDRCHVAEVGHRESLG